MEAGNRETDLKMTIQRRKKGGHLKLHFLHDQTKEVLVKSVETVALLLPPREED